MERRFTTLDVVRPVTKWATWVLEPDGLPGANHEAFERMATGRSRPTHVEAPPEAFLETGSPNDSRLQEALERRVHPYLE